MSEPVPDFTRTSMLEVVRWLDAALRSGAHLEFIAVDPDAASGSYPGETVQLASGQGLHRPWRAWTDLAQRFHLRLCTPRIVDGERVHLRFERLDPTRRAWSRDDDATERYGSASDFAKISKAEDPWLVADLRDAMERIALEPGARVLDLGVNDGAELELLDALGLSTAGEIVAIDHCTSALERARRRLPTQRHRFIQHDIGKLAELELGRFDLVISLDTLQSPDIDDRELLRVLIQRFLTDRASLLFGFPNSIYIDGEPLYGARTKNFTQPEASLLVKTVAHYRRYLQQHRRRVFVTGKDEFLVTAVARASPPRATLSDIVRA